MEIFDFVLALLPVIVSGLIIVYLYFQLFWKVKVIILNRFEKTYFFFKEKKLMHVGENVKIGDDTYILDRPTYFSGNKRVFFFEKGNSKPLSFIDIETVDAKKLNLILNSKMIEQLVKGVRPSTFDLKILMYIIIIAIIAIAFFMFFPNINPSTTTTSTVPTLTPPKP
jgi:hypothetical protein